MPKWQGDKMKTLVTLVNEANIDTSNLKNVNEFLKGLPLDELEASISDVKKDLLVLGISRTLSANPPHGVKVNTPEYSQYIHDTLKVFEKGYITLGAYKKATTPAKVKTQKLASKIPFSRNDIFDAIGEILPTGKDKKSVSARNAYVVIEEYSDEKWELFVLNNMLKSGSLVHDAIANLTSEKEVSDREAREAILADMVEL